MNSQTPSRRKFLKASAATASFVTAATPTLTSAQAQTSSPNRKLRVGFIGTGGRGHGAHVVRMTKHQVNGEPVELVAVCDVFNENRDKSAAHIKKNTGKDVQKYEDYRDMFAQANLDAVCIGTPDHWHAKQAIDALNAGLHVYCEKPMTKTVEEAIDVMRTWKTSGKVMQVGVQSTSLPVWNQINQLLTAGTLGKVLMYQTEFFRNSAQGQWRYYKLTPQMTPKNINWKKWLGVEEGLAEYEDFDRAVYRQWRRFWPYGSGMFTDLFVHRTTTMLKGTGLRFPGRVVGAGGLYLEYDGRDVPDVATVAADFPEGVQGLVTATMACQNTPIRQMIRGHHGSFVLGTGEQFDGFDFIPERPQVTRNSKLKEERIATESVEDTTLSHFKNWIDAMVEDDPSICNNDPELGAAAITTVILGAKSYREGKVFHFDDEALTIHEGDSQWAKAWEERSKKRGKPMHIQGWKAGDKGSTLEEPEYMKLAGPWKDGKEPGN
ncbi:MAG: Gfo/Idh/MocA family protein [Rubripirellula sp.]